MHAFTEANNHSVDSGGDAVLKSTAAALATYMLISLWSWPCALGAYACVPARITPPHQMQSEVDVAGCDDDDDDVGCWLSCVIGPALLALHPSPSYNPAQYVLRWPHPLP